MVSVKEEIAILVDLEEEVTAILQSGKVAPEGYTDLVKAKALLSIASTLAAISVNGISTYEA